MSTTQLAFPVPDGTVRVEVLGAGPSVLLVHGLSAHRAVWDPVARRLESGFRLHLPDLLGRGGSDPAPAARFRLVDEVDRLATVWRRIPDRPRLLVGHSQGALLAAVLAAREPSIAGLVLLNPVTPRTPRPAGLELFRFRPVRWAAARVVLPLRRPLARHILRRAYGPDTPVSEEAVFRYAEPYADPRRSETLLRTLWDWRPAEAAERLPGRPLAVRVLAGGADRRIGTEAPAALARVLGGRCDVVGGAGHVLPEERPERVAETVRRVWREMALSRRPGPGRPGEVGEGDAESAAEERKEAR